MRPLTDSLPKPLLKVAGRPLIEHHLLSLKAAGFTEFVINVAHMADSMIGFLGDGSTWGVTIHISREPEPLEVAGGIVRALPFLGSSPFLLVNGDVFTDFPFALLRAIKVPNQGAHLILVPNPPHNSEGDFMLTDSKVIGIDTEVTQLKGPHLGSSLTYAGVGLFDVELFCGLANGKRQLKPILERAIRNQALTGEIYEGLWVDVGTPDRLSNLNARFPNWRVNY